MGLAIIHSRASIGVQAPPVTVEVHISNGMPGFTLVGLPETTVKESRDRVRSAIINSRFEFPAKRITVNLAPADLPKEGDVLICRLHLAFWRPRIKLREISSKVTNLSANWRYRAKFVA